jgi:hypothetical protein
MPEGGGTPPPATAVDAGRPAGNDAASADAGTNGPRADGPPADAPPARDASVPDTRAPDAAGAPDRAIADRAAAVPTVTIFGETPRAHEKDVTSDNNLYVGAANRNFGADAAYDCGPLELGLLRFDLTRIPRNAVVLQARLRLVTRNESTGNGMALLYRMTEAWQEGNGRNMTGASNWNDRLPGVLWSVPGAGGPPSRAAAPAQTFDPRANAAAYEVDLPVALVQDWVATPASNHGVGCVSINYDLAGPSSHPHFHSRESPTPEARPELTITWTSP